MTPEEIARRFERRPGYELADYAPVALPLFRLTVDAVTMVHNEIPPIKEFVMRSIAAGFSVPRDVAGFLGLEDSVVDATFHQLRTDRYVTEHDDQGGVLLAEHGREVLAKARESAPQDEMLVFLYDRLLQKPLRLPPQQLLTPADIDLQKTIEIRPYPAEGPDIQNLSIPEVVRVLEDQAGGRAAFGRDLLRLKRITRRIRLFRSGVALVFKKVRSSEILIEFVVDDTRHEGLSHVFAERGGPKKMGFVKSIEESSTAAELRRYLGPEVQKLLPNQNDLDEKRLAVSIARIKHQAALTRADRLTPDSSDHPPVSSDVDEASRNLQQTEDELRGFPARPVGPFELAEFFDQAMMRSRSLLMISSRRLHQSFIDALFLKRLQDILSAGARVVISVVEHVGTDPAALDLERLRSKFPRLDLRSGRRAQFYHLVSDNRFALVSNRPFLGNAGKVKSFHQTVGYLLQREDLVNAFVTRLDPNNRASPAAGSAND